MKQIMTEELKKGDWFRTEPIYNTLNNKNQFIGISHLCYVKGIEEKDIKGTTIKIKVWTIDDNKITKGGMIVAGEEIYTLSKEELLHFKKQIILEELK